MSVHPQGVRRGCLEEVLAPEGCKGLKPQQHTQHGHVGLLELLPQPHQAQHGLGDFAGEHLEGDELADGEVLRVHHDIGAHDQDEQGHELLQAIGDDVVGVADLAHAEAGVQVFGEVVAILGAELGFIRRPWEIMRIP